MSINVLADAPAPQVTAFSSTKSTEQSMNADADNASAKPDDHSRVLSYWRTETVERHMKVQVMSDLHTGYPGARGFPPLAQGVDIVMIAGDVCEGLPQAVKEARAAYPTAHIVQIAGNHEFYGDATYSTTLAAGRECALKHGVHLLENQSANFGKLRVLGATLWTDYGLLGEAARLHAMRTAQDIMRDHAQSFPLTPDQKKLTVRIIR